MKDFISCLLVLLVLVVIFSTGCIPEDVFRPLGSVGTQHPGDSGIVLPGNGAEPMEINTLSNTERTNESSSSETEIADEVENEILTETKMEVQNNMGDILLAFWHGVAAVLIGETVALMVAVAWMKIKISNEVDNENS